jgi:hypothetical protein
LAYERLYGGVIETRRQPVAEQSEDLARFVPQRRLLALNPGWANKREPELR